MGKKLIRQQLHNYIDTADDIVVQSIFNLVKNDIEVIIPKEVLEETLKISDGMKSGKLKSISEKEFHSLTKKYRRNVRTRV